jgi:hypothetical protein
MESYKRQAYQITELAEKIRRQNIGKGMTIYESLELAKKQLNFK